MSYKSLRHGEGPKTGFVQEVNGLRVRDCEG